MFCTVQLDGVPIGQVELSGAPRAIGILLPLGGYSDTGLRSYARGLGLALSILGSRLISGAVIGRALAGAVLRFHRIQQRLSLVDIRGGHIAVIHVVLAEFSRDARPVVVAELREQASQIPAPLRLIGRRDSGSSRPAA